MANPYICFIAHRLGEQKAPDADRMHINFEYAGLNDNKISSVEQEKVNEN